MDAPDGDRGGGFPEAFDRYAAAILGYARHLLISLWFKASRPARRACDSSGSTPGPFGSEDALLRPYQCPAMCGRPLAPA